jgi:hypothetical protein
MAAFFALFLAGATRLSPLQRYLCLGILSIALVIIMIDPGDLYAWWLD